MTRNELFEYHRGFLDAARGRGYNDGAVDTRGYIIVLRLTSRPYASFYANGFEDGLAYSGAWTELALLEPI